MQQRNAYALPNSDSYGALRYRLQLLLILNELLAAAQRLRTPNQHPKRRTDKL
ncbi:hypothetical protein [Dolichospermum sp. UHCC 0352]|uniref:hypothetical protein n=1 Tax=Dolichospermum sp. UHCC 0352 TaxID=2590011 RepID=UPI001444F675|nr:hypothetical protein [Dolichospermum sp. UHCC 0352]MBO1050864.1 hypothetical protein [Dolichospermum sp. DET73]